MPSRMIHYCIGNEIAKAISLNSSLFIIGNLSPDAHDGSYYGVGSSHYKTAYKPDIDKYPVIDLNTFKIKYLNNCKRQRKVQGIRQWKCRDFGSKVRKNGNGSKGFKDTLSHTI